MNKKWKEIHDRSIDIQLTIRVLTKLLQGVLEGLPKRVALLEVDMQVLKDRPELASQIAGVPQMRQRLEALQRQVDCILLNN